MGVVAASLRDAYDLEHDVVAAELDLPTMFDVYPPDTVGTNASPQNPWIVWDTRPDGTKVFDQFGPGNAPAGATAICAVVATDVHAVDEIDIVADTVSCVDLP